MICSTLVNLQLTESPVWKRNLNIGLRTRWEDIRNEARRWRLGVLAGAALDPELFMFGVHSQIGPIFNRNIIFRPNAEFAFGEVTDLIALNLEAIYRLPVAARGKSWNAYFGAGQPSPSFTRILSVSRAKAEISTLGISIMKPDLIFSPE